MRTHVIVSMRSAFARRYAIERSLLDVSMLLSGIETARLIGSPGYSMRISVEEREAYALTCRLEPNFVIEPGILMVGAADWIN